MDQVKEYLQIAIKYRFWIVVGIAALMPLIGYFAAAGSIEAETTAKTGEIKTTYEGVQKYGNGDVVNDQYAPLVEGKTKILTSDVNAAWETLYERQAPLLTWPEAVADRFQEWGPKWPENTDPLLIKQAIIDYIETYRPYVTGVYQTLKPFDFETGEGIVVAPPAEQLLMHPDYDINPDKMPDYGKIWNTQRRLWVQRTVLDVLAKVNERAGAKDWSSAAVKQILDLQVANDLAQDQRSMGKGDALKDAPKIDAPGSEAAAAAAAPAAGAANDMASAEAAMMASGSMMSPMMGMGMTKANPEEFKLLPVPNEKQVYVVPVYLSVYVEQDRIPDLLVEFSNSPMNIQIIEFAMYKAEPGAVEKPEKGGKQPGMANMRGYGMMDEMMMGYGMMPGTMPGGMMSAADQQMMMSMMSGSAMNSGMMPGMMSGMGMGTAKPEKKGVDVRSETLAKLKGENKETDEDEAKKKDKKPKVIDQYYNVVRVDLYGQARFFFPPPRPETPEPSESVNSELAGADGASAESPEAATEPGAEVTEAPAPAEPGTEPTGDQPAADAAMPNPEPTPVAEPAAEAKDQPAPPSDSATPTEPDAGTAEPKADANGEAEPKADAEPAPAPDAGAEPSADAEPKS